VERFHGTFEFSLDAKGRLILPARFRNEFDTRQAYVSAFVGGCLALFPPAQFAKYLARAEAMESRGPEGRHMARVLSALSTDVEFDAQWRITIPPHLREFASLEPNRPVTVLGALNRVELWQAEKWHQSVADGVQSLIDGSSPLFDSVPPPSSDLQPAADPR
jgi:MraZ protein